VLEHISPLIITHFHFNWELREEAVRRTMRAMGDGSKVVIDFDIAKNKHLIEFLVVC
jgi:hypothetical protein